MEFWKALSPLLGIVALVGGVIVAALDHYKVLRRYPRSTRTPDQMAEINSARAKTFFASIAMGVVGVGLILWPSL